jgi:hypothetical protein
MKLLLAIVILSIFVIAVPINVKGNETPIGRLNTSDSNSNTLLPTSEFIDYDNGTTQTTIDNNDGTIDVITETLTIDTAQINIGEDAANQLMEIGTPTSTEECTDWIPVTQNVIFDPEIMMGVTYELISEEYEIIDVGFDALVLKAYAYAAIVLDVGFGLRLPVDITIEHPEQMTVEHDYTWYATLTPVDNPSIKEFKCSLVAGVVLSAGVWTPLTGWIEHSETFGPDLDKSVDFITPVGPDDSFPIGEFGITILNFWLMKIKVMFEPELTSQKITAEVNCGGDSSGSHTLTWTDGGQEIPFIVHADDYDTTTDYATVELSNFRYYFTDFLLKLKLKFDFDPWIDWLTGDPTITLFTLDLSSLIGGAYLGVHQGYPSTIDIEVFVKNLVLLLK